MKKINRNARLHIRNHISMHRMQAKAIGLNIMLIALCCFLIYQSIVSDMHEQENTPSYHTDDDSEFNFY